MNSKFILVFVWLALCCLQNLHAAPAAPVEFELTQPDGSTFWAVSRGDEYVSWTETIEGHTVIKVGDTWYYAEDDGAGSLQASSIPVGKLSAAQKQLLPKHLAPDRDPADFESRTIRKISREDEGSGDGLDLPQTISHTQYVLTILVNYSNISFSYSDASFQSLIYGASDSVKDFFLENSYNGFTIAAPAESYGTANDGIVHVTRPVNHPNQGGSSLTSRTEARSIVSLTNSFVNYASFDANGDGVVSPDELAIVIIVAGYETSYGGTANSLTPNVWGHQSVFLTNLTLDGKILSPYTMFGERHGRVSGTHQATIGIMCHELGHLMLGLPDLYDTDSSSYGIGVWGLMGGGSWNNVGGLLGESPAHLSAWSKVVTGLTIAEDIDTNQNGVSIAQAETNEVAKRIWVDKYKSSASFEYFLVENRQKTGYDTGLPGAGLLIWHIDEERGSNSTESHKLVDLEEADGLAQMDLLISSGNGGDTFPGTTNNPTFNYASNPNSNSYAGSHTGISVTSVSASGANMTANFSSVVGSLGGHVRYDENLTGSRLGYEVPTAWAGLRVSNDTSYESFDGVDVYVTDLVGATIELRYYSSMTGGTPVGLIHSQAGFAAGPGWNRLLLNTPQSFPSGAERGVVLRIVNNSYGYPLAYDNAGPGSGRSYYSSNGVGAFNAFCPSYCGDLNLTALLGNVNIAPGFTPASTVTRQRGSPAGAAVSVGTVSDAETTAGALTVTQIAGGTATGVTVSGINNTDGNVTATLAASCSATSGTVRFQVSDGSAAASGDLQVNVTANSLPTLSYGAKSVNFSAASSHAALTGPSDNGTVNSVSVQGSGTYTGSISVNSAGLVSLSGAQPVGAHTITIRASDNCSANQDASFQLEVDAILPAAPAIGIATAGNNQASVSFTPPGFNGGAAISEYTVTSNPAGLTATGAASPLTVLGLGNGQSYTFTVTATNSTGTGPASAASNSVTPMGTQTISFAQPGDQDFGTTPSLTATANSGLAVLFSSATPASCSITTDGALTFLTTGSCSINADQPGNAVYLAAPQVTRTFTINAVIPPAPTMGTATAGVAEATVSFTPPDFDGGAAISAYTVTSNPGGLTSGGAGSPITVTGLTNGQAYTFTVTVTNSAGTSSPSEPSNEVTPIGTQTISFANPGDQDFGTSPSLAATATSGLPVSFISNIIEVCTLTPEGTLNFVSIGNCSIDADQVGDAAYLPALTITQVFTVHAVVPSAPGIGIATAGNTQVSVNFTPAGFDGGASITSYTAVSNPGNLTGVGVSSPIVVEGLTNGQAYTFTVTAANAVGAGAASDASNEVTPTIEVEPEIFKDGFESH